MNIGIAQFSVCDDRTKFLEGVSRIGLGGAEPIIDSADSEYLSWSVSDVDRFVNHAKALGIQIPSVAVSAFINDSSLVDGNRAQAEEIIKRSLSFTGNVGARVMLLCTFFASDPDTPSKKSNLMDVLDDIRSYANDLGIKIALESPLQAEELAELVDSAGIGVYYDLGNAIYLGYDPAHEIEVLGPRIVSIHIKDTFKTLGDSHLGKGKLDLAASMKAIKNISYDGWLIIETPYGDVTATHEDIRILKDHLSMESVL